MIRTEAGLRSTHDALMNLQLALWGLYREKERHGRKGLEIMGEGVVAEIFRLRKEIDDLVGLTEYVAEFGVPPTNEEIDAMAASGSSPRRDANGTPLQPQPGESTAAH